MLHQANIGNRFLLACDRLPLRTAFVLANSRISYAGVRTLVLSFAIRLRDLGIGPGSLVAVATDHLPVSVAAHQAIALLGATWVQATREVLNNPAIPVTHLLHDTDHSFPVAPNIIAVDQSWARLPDLGTNHIDVFNGPANPDDIWMYAQSSGTTGDPKLIPITYENISRRLDLRKEIHLVEGMTVAGSGPALAFPTVNASLMIIMEGGTFVVNRDPTAWEREGVQMIFGTPLQHRKRLGDAPPPERKFEAITIGGAKASSRFIEYLQDFVETIYVGYGSSEAGPICRNSVRPGPEFDNLGRPHNFVNVEIVDQEDQPLPAGTEGEVRVRTPCMVSRYAFADEASARAFRNGWFHPGDTGILDEEGQLRITGRINDQLSIGGVKVNAVRIDGLVEDLPEVAQSMAFVADLDNSGLLELVVAVRLKNPRVRMELVARRIRDLCGMRIGRSVTPTAIIFVDEIPVNERGKPLRRSGMKLLDGRERW